MCFRDSSVSFHRERFYLPFLAFHDPDIFEKYRQVILQNITLIVFFFFPEVSS